MPFSVEVHKKAAKALEKLEPTTRERIKEALRCLQDEPVPITIYDVVKLEGSAHTYRIRVGKYRIIYDVYWNEKKVWVLIIEKKRDKTYKF